MSDERWTMARALRDVIHSHSDKITRALVQTRRTTNYYWICVLRRQTVNELQHVPAVIRRANCSVTMFTDVCRCCAAPDLRYAIRGSRVPLIKNLAPGYLGNIPDRSMGTGTFVWHSGTRLDASGEYGNRGLPPEQGMMPVVPLYSNPCPIGIGVCSLCRDISIKISNDYGYIFKTNPWRVPLIEGMPKTEFFFFLLWF